MNDVIVAAICTDGDTGFLLGDSLSQYPKHKIASIEIQQGIPVHRGDKLDNQFVLITLVNSDNEEDVRRVYVTMKNVFILEVMPANKVSTWMAEVEIAREKQRALKAAHEAEVEAKMAALRTKTDSLFTPEIVPDPSGDGEVPSEDAPADVEPVVEDPEA